jgi:hypothetical protein
MAAEANVAQRTGRNADELYGVRLNGIESIDDI